MNHQHLYNIANALRHRLSDSHRVDVIHTGGNVWCVEVVAPAEDEDDTEVRLTIGDASGETWGFDVELSLGSGALLHVDSFETSALLGAAPHQVADAVLHTYRQEVAL